MNGTSTYRFLHYNDYAYDNYSNVEWNENMTYTLDNGTTIPDYPNSSILVDNSDNNSVIYLEGVSILQLISES